jgi:hypothetical protein
MPAFLDGETFKVRAGPKANDYGDPWRSICSVTVQYDRRVYMYAIASNIARNDAVTDMKDMIRVVREEAKRWGWTEILWTRERADGTTHLARIPIKSKGEPNASST